MSDLQMSSKLKSYLNKLFLWILANTSIKDAHFIPIPLLAWALYLKKMYTTNTTDTRFICMYMTFFFWFDLIYFVLVLQWNFFSVQIRLRGHVYLFIYFFGGVWGHNNHTVWNIWQHHYLALSCNDVVYFLVWLVSQNYAPSTFAHWSPGVQ